MLVGVILDISKTKDFAAWVLHHFGLGRAACLVLCT
jgi:hypothetical protein